VPAAEELRSSKTSSAQIAAYQPLYYSLAPTTLMVSLAVQAMF